jgi:hypothetical protein
MKRLLILGAAFFAAATFLPSMSRAEIIECAAEMPAGRSGHWFYRIIDGRKCWYQGKTLVPKSSLRWPDSSVPEAKPATSEEQAVNSEQQAAKLATDGRNVAPLPATEPAAWPAPQIVNDISFESRWLGLRTRN